MAWIYRPKSDGADLYRAEASHDDAVLAVVDHERYHADCSQACVRWLDLKGAEQRATAALATIRAAR